MSDDVTTLLERYAERYMAGDADAIAAMCEVPFLAVRRGALIHLGDREAVVAHFAANIAGYQSTGARSADILAIDALPLGDLARFATVTWHVGAADGSTIREFRTSCQLAGDPLRILSYVNHDVRPAAGT